MSSRLTLSGSACSHLLATKKILLSKIEIQLRVKLHFVSKMPPGVTKKSSTRGSLKSNEDYMEGEDGCVRDEISNLARSMGPTRGPSGVGRTQVGPM